jgi:hypothetical protein
MLSEPVDFSLSLEQDLLDAYVCCALRWRILN